MGVQSAPDVSDFSSWQLTQNIQPSEQSSIAFVQRPGSSQFAICVRKTTQKYTAYSWMTRSNTQYVKAQISIPQLGLVWNPFEIKNMPTSLWTYDTSCGLITSVLEPKLMLGFEKMGYPGYTYIGLVVKPYNGETFTDENVWIQNKS